MATFVEKQVPPLPNDEADDQALPTVEADEVITELQMPCTVVITGLPKAAQDDTTKALSETFAAVGTVTKTIYQIDGDQQHAVVVLDSSDAATAACAMSGCAILGGTVNIIRAQQLQGEDESMKMTAHEGHTNKMFGQAKMATIGVGASAIVLGAQAADSIKGLDQQLGVSKTVNAAATATAVKVIGLDQQLGVSKTVGAAAASVTEGVKGIDEKYDISGRTTRAASDATKAATDWANKALENPTVSKGWGFMKGLGKSMLSSAVALGKEADDTYKQANQQARERRGLGAENSAGEKKEGDGEKEGGAAPAVAEDPAATL
jgi:hypothetical protein